MTTGTWSVGTNTSTAPFYGRKTWSGTDGRYEAGPDGKPRDKWNTYDMDHRRWTQSNVVGPYGYAGICPASSINEFKTLTGWTNNDDLRLLNKLAEEIKGHSFDLAINMAEAGKTYGLILNNVRSLGSSLVALKRGRPGDALRALGVPERRQRRLRARDVSGRWLEMQYGWRPLIDQSYEAAKALESLTGPRRLRFTVSSSKTRDNDFSASPPVYRLVFRSTLNVKIIAELYEELSIWRAMGLTNPAAVVWEVVPYSFCVDWFLPVGSYLSAWGVIPALKGRFLTMHKGSHKGARFSKLGPFPLAMPSAGSGLKETYFRFQRRPSSSLTVPRPQFNSLPRALSPAHLYNAVALVHQRLK